METTYQKQRHSRRSALKKIVAGAGVAAGFTALPDSWTRPLVDTVLLPAHAQMSDPCVILRSDELETIRLDCPMEPFRSNYYFISIDDVTNPGCPELLVSHSDPGGNRLALFYEVSDRYVGGKKARVWMDEGFSSENEIE